MSIDTLWEFQSPDDPTIVPMEGVIVMLVNLINKQDNNCKLLMMCVCTYDV